MERSPLFPSFSQLSVSLLSSARASFPPTVPQVCGCIWGPRKGAPSLPRSRLWPFLEGKGFSRTWALNPEGANSHMHMTLWFLAIKSLTLSKHENLSAGISGVWGPRVLGEATPVTGGLDPWL